MQKIGVNPYAKAIGEKIGRILEKHKMNCVHIPINKISGIVRKDKILLECHST